MPGLRPQPSQAPCGGNWKRVTSDIIRSAGILLFGPSLFAIVLRLSCQFARVVDLKIAGIFQCQDQFDYYGPGFIFVWERDPVYPSHCRGIIVASSHAKLKVQSPMPPPHHLHSPLLGAALNSTIALGCMFQSNDFLHGRRNHKDTKTLNVVFTGV